MTDLTSQSDESESSPVPSDEVLEQNGESDSLDVVFATLKNRRRRYVLYYLHQRGETPVDDLVDLIAASERDDDGAADDDQVRIGLRHTHLPKLVEADIVEYDDAAERVRLASGRPHLGPHIDEAARAELA